MTKGNLRHTIIHFRRWSRKKTAILASFSRTIKICSLCLAYGLVNKSFVAKAQPDSTEIYAPAMEIDEIEVVGQGGLAAFPGMSRIATVVRTADIDRAGIRNLDDLLEYVANVDMRQRGNEGIQTDISIRGGSFDHVLVLLNGIILNDPQTGHVSLDLPVDMEMVDRIEVLQGPAARLYGPSAATGALNIITREPTGNTVSISYATGNYKYGRTQAALGYAGRVGKGMLSLSHARSDGYTENTDFKRQNIFYRHRMERDYLSLDLQAGFQRKRFGANGFYTPRFPGQFEEADVVLGSIRAETGGRIRIAPVFYWRQRRDHFVLVRENPEFYQNYHRTNTLGSQLKFTYTAGNMVYSNSMNLRSEHVISNSLGYEAAIPVKIRGTDSLYYDRQYGRTNMSWSQEIAFRNADLDIAGGIMLYWNTAYPGRPELFPGLDMSYRVFRTARIYASYNRAGTVPTFTDLFYTDPDNQGNQQLEPASIRSFEAGIRYAGSHSSGSLGYFTSSGRDIINWQWSSGQSRFKPFNLPKYNVSGIEAEFHTDFSGHVPGNKVLRDLTVSYMYLKINKSLPDSVSKYDNLRHKLSVVFSHILAGNTRVVWRFSYQDRLGNYITYDTSLGEYSVHRYTPFFIADIQIYWERNGFSAFAELSNLFDTRYVDAGSLQQPGRWLKAGIRVSMGPEKP